MIIKKQNDTKKCVTRQKSKYEDYEHYLQAIQLENKKKTSRKK